MIEINGWIILVQLTSFLVLMLVLSKFFFGPIALFLEKRRVQIDESFALVKKEQEESSKLIEEARERLKSTENKTKILLDGAIKDGEEKKNEIIAKAKSEADGLVKKAGLEIEKKKDEAVLEIKKGVTDITIAISRKIIKEELNEERAQRLINEFAERVSTEDIS
ncbi:MAG: F0F1 ATP synthase subunit B [bacterium]|nr:F0F1 ATP synthase subunit B [bacterium]